MDLCNEGQRVLPGQPLGRTTQNAAEGDLIATGPGTRSEVLAAEDDPTPYRIIIATKAGVVHWEGAELSVLAAPPQPSDARLIARAAAQNAVDPLQLESNVNTAPTCCRLIGPSMHSVVHLRVMRVGRVASIGDIIAVDGAWCSGGFRGSVKIDDLFACTGKEAAELSSMPMIAFMRPGDVVVAIVVGLSDSRQVQLSTSAEFCGVVQGKSRNGAPLERIPGNRREMRCSATGNVEPRWASLRDVDFTQLNAVKN